MKAMVMAAGKGTRLRPLTYTHPKPMVPIVNKPALEHCLELLEEHGFNQVVINVHTHAAQIRKYFEREKRFGMKILFSDERRLMGTAGGVKKAGRHFDRTFLVMSGDGLTDINLTDALAFHRQKRALITIAVKRIDARLDYGVVITDRACRVKEILEKPQWSDVFHNRINAGIYIMEPAVLRYMPSDTFFDFAHDLLPLLLRRREKVIAYETQGYWCDIGNLSEYRRAQHDVLDGKVAVTIPGKKVGRRIWIDEGTHIPRNAKIFGPCLIGKNCYLGNNVTIEPYCIIGDGCRIEAFAHLKDCILWQNVRVHRNVSLTHCVIGQDAEVVENISVFEGSVINIRQ